MKMLLAYMALLPLISNLAFAQAAPSGAPIADGAAAEKFTADFAIQALSFYNQDFKTSASKADQSLYVGRNRYMISTNAGSFSIHDLDLTQINKINGHTVIDLLGNDSRVAQISGDPASGAFHLTLQNTQGLKYSQPTPEMYNRMEDFLRSRKDLAAKIVKLPVYDQASGQLIQYLIQYCAAPKANFDACKAGDPLNDDYFNGVAGVFSRKDRDVALAQNAKLALQLPATPPQAVTPFEVKSTKAGIPDSVNFVPLTLPGANASNQMP